MAWQEPDVRPAFARRPAAEPPAAAPVLDGLQLDGNALAGPLSRLFAPEMTSATVRCGACGLAGPLAAARLYAHAPGNVLRCRGCGTAVLRLIVADDRIHLDMPMGTALTVPVPPAGA